MKKLAITFSLLLTFIVFSQQEKVKMYKATNVTKTIYGETPTTPTKLSKNVASRGFTGGGTVNGSIVADLSVSSSGGVDYSVPINVPPGLNGIQPDISLDFDSHSGNGLAGWGWNVSGVSVITRIPSTMFHDNQIDPVDFDLDDRFALDGKRLIVKTGTYGVAGSEYQTEQYSNLKIVAYGSNSIPGVQGPGYFRVFYPDGSIGHYDTVSYADYALTYWENPQGVRISYEYQTENNTLRIHKIKYGSKGTATPVNSIEFIYKDRKFREVAYIGGIQFVRNQILKQIKILGNNQPYRVYNLGHSNSSFNYQLLTSIGESEVDFAESRYIRFKYPPPSGIHNVTFQENSGTTQTNLNHAEQRNANVVSLDFTGNGKMDFVVYPTIGSNAKKEFWLYEGIQSSINSSSTIDKGRFQEMFAVNWLDDQNRLRLSQALALVQNIGTNEVDFRIMAKPPPSVGSIGTAYIKTWDAPTYKPQNYYQFNNPNINRVPLNYISGDFDGDGLSDIIALERKYTASSCIENPSASDPSCPYKVIRNGIEYCCYACSTSTYNSTSAKAYLIKLDRRITTGFVSSIGSLAQELKATDKLLAMDANGDGRSNIVHITDGKISVYGLNKTNSSLTKLWETLNSNINLDFPPLPGDYNGDGKGDVLIPLANNSDSFLMFLSRGVQYDTIDYLLQSFDFRFSEISGNTYYGYNLIPADINGDGKTDIIEYNTQVGIGNTTGSQYIRAHQNTVKAVSLDKPIFIPGNPIQDTRNMEAYPIPIFLSSEKPNSNLEFASLSDKWVNSYEFLKDHREHVTLEEIDNNGVITTIKYDVVNSEDQTSGPGYYAPQSVYTQTYPFVNTNVAPSFKVVKELEQVGAGFTRKQEFYYEGAVSHVGGLGFLGFEVMKQSNWNGTDVPAIWTISKYDPMLRGALTERIVANTNATNPSGYKSKVNYLYDYKLIANPGSPVAPYYEPTIDQDESLTENILDEAEVSIRLLPGFYANAASYTYHGKIVPPNEQPGAAGYAGAVDIRLKRMETDNGLTGVFSTETYTYDQYNNPLTTTSIFPGGNRKVTNTYLNNPTATNNTYHIGRLQKMTEKVTLNGNTFSTESKYTYDNNLVKKVEKKGNGTGWLTEVFTHDAYGNILTTTLSGNQVPTRTETFEYDDTNPTYGGRFLTKSISIDGLETVFEYYTDRGTLKKVTDPYGLETSYEYDKWDRILKETDYLSNVTDHTYTSLTGGALRHNTDYATGAKEQTTYNAFGWVTQTGTLSLNNQWVYKDFEYYLDGKSKRESEPHNSSPSQWNTVVYDEYSRPISRTLYTGRSITYSYSDPSLTSTVNDQGKMTTTTLDALGNIVKVVDQGGTVDYTYFANGVMKTADYEGNVVTLGIDGWGRKTSLSDPSAGNYSYSYNAYGELLTQTTPKGNTTYKYDNFGKVIEEIMTGDLTNHSLKYDYDNFQRLKRIDGKDNTNGTRTYTYEYEYDPTHKVLKKVTEDTGLASFEYDITYDPQYGRVEKEKLVATLSSGATKTVTTRNVYDTSGILKEIWNDGTPNKLWELGSINARGQALTVNLGNGMAKTKVYDAYGYLEKIEDKEGGTAPNPTLALHMEYSFHQQLGTLTNRKNFGLNWQETFGYDTQDRLTTIIGDVTHTKTYEASGVKRGNIQNNSALGDYNYADSGKKYRLTSIDPNATGETYFQNHPTQTITYNAFKKPIDIHQQGHGRVSFEYGPMMTRSTAYFGGENEDKTARRYKKHYSSIIPAEIVQDAQAGTTKIIIYVGGDAYSAPIAHIKTTGAGAVDEYHYLHRDYLGSILAITDADGDVIEERQFGAWGVVDKFLDSGGGTTYSHESLLGRGYTGHEHFFEVGLIHMNGRMYDPQLGRFLSPDNFIQDPFNTQNYNRYGYVLNNPLMYIDPSGESFFGTIWEGIKGIGGFIGSIATDIARFLGWTGGEEYVYGYPVGEPPTPKMNTNNSNIASSASRPSLRESRGGPGPWKNRLSQYWDGYKTGYKGYFTGIKDGVVNYWDRLTNDPWGLAKDNFRENLKNLIPGRAAYKIALEPQIDRTVNAWRASKAAWNGDYYGAGVIAGGQAAGDTVELGAMALTAGAGKVVTSGMGRMFSRSARSISNSITRYRNGTFSVSDWTGYPGGPKPSGTFRLLEGAEYQAARKLADKTNRALREANPEFYKGKQIHEIKPIKFGGSPTDPANKILLTPAEHSRYTTFWNRMMRELNK